MKNKEIADIFERIGTLLEFKDENVFKIRAYHKASENIWSLGEDIENLRKENRLDEIPGVGKALQDKIIEYLDTGHISAYEELIKEVPSGLFEMMQIPSMGPKKAKMFYDKLGITSVEDLAKAAQEGKLNGLPGIKEKTIQNILRGIKITQEHSTCMNLGRAYELGEEFIGALKKLKEVKQIEAAGSLRRRKEIVRDIDILVDSSEPEKVMETFVHLPQVRSINAHGSTKSSILTRDNVQVDVRIVEPLSYGAALLYFTGSKNFNVKLRQLAIKKGMKVSEYGIFKIQGEKEKFLAGKTEEECFKALGLPYVPPELREDIGEEAIFSGEKIPKLLELKNIKGDLHVHSSWSDGQNTIAEMAQAAQARGYQYIGISDHSAKLKIAGGVTPENLKKKKKEIDRLNNKLKNFRILFGTELEIDSEGNLDYNDKILSEFDFVVASIHSGFEQGKAQLTNRIIKACRNKYVHAIGHPTGRHIGKRDSYDLDLKEICKVAVDTNTYLEINSFPLRLDLDSANVYYSRSLGVKFTINTDAHSVEHLDFIRFGAALARRGWLTPKDVLNTCTLAELEKELKKKRK